jgi:hypothetical protein
LPNDQTKQYSTDTQINHDFSHDKSHGYYTLCKKMKNLNIILSIVAILLTGCKVVHFEVFEHAETQKYQRQFVTELPSNVFEKHANLVDSGILFIPKLRELALEPSYRSFVSFYSKQKNEIFVDRIIISTEDPEEKATLIVKKTIEITEIDETTGFLRSSVPAFFGDVENAGRILLRDTVRMSVYYRIAGHNTERRMDFILIRKEVSDRAWIT